MSQLFPPVANSLIRLSLLGIVAGVCFVAWIGFLIVRSPWEMGQDIPRQQPVPFSHEHHAGGLGIDCRYCHTTVERSAFANVPPTKVCMNCHSQLWTVAPVLQPVRESYLTDKSLRWTRVNDLPDYVYFNHEIHVNKGVGCVSCHGRVDRMPLTWQASNLTMGWCLNCHRHPEQYVRPREAVFDMAYTPSPNQLAVGSRVVRQYHIKKLTSCDTCHR